jgi:hypothetical protein
MLDAINKHPELSLTQVKQMLKKPCNILSKGLQRVRDYGLLSSDAKRYSFY